MPNVDACDSSKLHVVPFQGESILRALRPLDCRIANPTEAKSGGKREREEGALEVNREKKRTKIEDEPHSTVG